MNKKMNNKGFSLVELIIVIAIMAILIGVLAPMLYKYVEKSRESTDITNLDTCVSAVQAFYAEGTIPSGGITITGASGSFVASGMSGSDDPLGDAGLTSNALKSSSWTTDLSATISATGGVTYAGEATYYVANGSGTGFDPKP